MKFTVETCFCHSINFRFTNKSNYMRTVLTCNDLGVKDGSTWNKFVAHKAKLVLARIYNLNDYRLIRFS